MPFGLPDYVFTGLILFAIGAGMGGFAAWLPRYVRWNVGNFRIAEIYDERPGGYYLLRRLRIGLGTQSFTVGKDFEFSVPFPAPVVLYNGSHGVLHYVLSKERPRHLQVGKRIVIKPETVAVQVPPNVPGNAVVKVIDGPNGKRISKTVFENPDTESRSTHLTHKRGLIEQLAKATGGASLKSMLPFVILAALTALMLGYVIFTTFHPGFFPAPPPGYCYKAIPFDNMTHTVQGCLAP